MPSQDELVELIINAMDSLESGNPALNKLASYLYKADDKLPEFLEKLKIYTELENPTRKETQEAGKLLEQIVLLLFKGVGLATMKKFCHEAAKELAELNNADFVEVSQSPVELFLAGVYQKSTDPKKPQYTFVPLW